MRRAVFMRTNAGTLASFFVAPRAITAMSAMFSRGRVALAVWACWMFVGVEARGVTDISVNMEIACFTVAGCGTNWSKEAGGVRFPEGCPAFCYRISVTNSGSVGLRNITVTDTALGDLTTYFNFPPTLAPGDFRTGVLLPATICSDLTNVVTAVGQKDTSSQRVTDRDSVVARTFVGEAGIYCDVFLTSPDDVDGDPTDGRVTFPPDGDLHLLSNSVRVCNPGNLNLENVRITDPPLERFGPDCSNSIRSISFNLPAGQCRTVALCTVVVSECLMPRHQVLVTAQVAAPTNGYCSDQSTIRVVNSQCALDFICVAIQLARGLPEVRTGLATNPDGPKLNSQCGVTGTNAMWFRLSKDPYYPEGVAEISTLGSDWDTILWVFSGALTSPTNLTLLACNDDVSSLKKQSRVTFKFPPPGSGAGPYWLVVDGKGMTNGILTLITGYAPALESYRFASSNSFELRSAIAPPLAYQLEASTNLALHPLGWSTVLATNLTTDFPFLEFTDTNARVFRQRYFRIVPPSQ